MSSNEFETANGFTKFLAHILNPDATLTEAEDDLWTEIKVNPPLVNNLIVKIPSGKEYIIQVKPVSK